MILSTRTVKAAGLPLEDPQDGIECTILSYQKHHRLVVGVHVPVVGASKTPTKLTSAPKEMNLSSAELDSISSAPSDDDSFRRELQDNDAAFLKRITESDTVFRAKIAESSKVFIDGYI